MRARTLDRLLDDDLTTDPVTAGGLSNHRPMALVALAGLGASDDRLRSFADAYGDRRASFGGAAGDHLVPCRPELVRSAARFVAEIERDGPGPVLGRHLAGLADGVGGAAFHGLIRLGYGLDHGRPADVAGGIAYLTEAAQPIIAPHPREGRPAGGVAAAARSAAAPFRTRSPSEFLADLRGHPDLAQRSFTVGGFSRRFAEVAADPTFVALAGRVWVDAGSLRDLAEITHRLYRSTRDFFALHTMTATHAARIATEHVASRAVADAVVRGVTRAIGAAYVVIGTPPVYEAVPGDEAPAWPEIAEALVASDDPHVIKLGYTCHEEQGAWGDDRYRRTAAEAAGVANR